MVVNTGCPYNLYRSLLMPSDDHIPSVENDRVMQYGCEDVHDTIAIRSSIIVDGIGEHDQLRSQNIQMQNDEASIQEQVAHDDTSMGKDDESLRARKPITMRQ